MQNKLKNYSVDEENIPLLKRIPNKNNSFDLGKKNILKELNEEIETEISLSFKNDTKLDNLQIYDFNINSFIYELPSQSFFREKAFAKETTFFIYIKISMLIVFFIFLTLEILKFSYKK